MSGREPVLAVFDREKDYTLRLVEYARSRKNLPFEVCGFTEESAFENFAKSQKPDLLLIRPDGEGEILTRVKAEKILLLDDERYGGSGAYPSVRKYQSAKLLLKEVTDFYSASRKAESLNAAHIRSCDVYAVYSPAGGCRKTSFALTLAKVLSRERAVLYINLENHSALAEVAGETFEGSFGELLYFIRLHKAGFAGKLARVCVSSQNLDLAPPPDNYGDICAAKGEEWLRLLDTVRSECGYEAVVLDLGDGIQDLYDVLDTALRVFVPLREDPVAKAKYKAFEEGIRRWGNPALADRLEPLYLPFLAVAKTGREYLEGLAWSRMGDTVRALLRVQE